METSPIIFTQRELEIIRLICEQNLNQEIAYKLLISRRTLEKRIKTIKSKMKIDRMLGIVVYAIKHGIYQI